MNFGQIHSVGCRMHISNLWSNSYLLRLRIRNCIQIGLFFILWKTLDHHNAVASAVHWSLCAQYGFPQSEQWWQHQPQPVLDNDWYKLLYDFNIFTDKRISARRPDIVCIDKYSGCETFIDETCVMDRHVIDKHREKTEKYLNWL